jgi:hypothetical protein
MALLEAQPAQDMDPGHALFLDAAEVSLRPEVRIVGSVARAAIMSTSLSDRRPNGRLRDVDTVRFGDRGKAPQLASGREVDTGVEGWIASDRSHLVFPYDNNLQVPIRHPEVFDAYNVSRNEVTIRTLHPDVLGKTNTMPYIKRPKDKVAIATYNDFLASQDDHLHPELLEPFDEMEQALRHRLGYRARGTLRNVYYLIVPESVRRSIQISHKIPGLGVKSDRS